MGLLGDITDGIGLTDNKGAKKALGRANAMARENKKEWQGLLLPHLDWQELATEAYDPETVDYQTVSEDPAIRNMQMRALEKMGNLAETGLSDEDALGFEEAKRLGNRTAKSGRDAALQNAEMRGVAGSGLEFAMKEMAQQDGAEATRMAALQQAAETARQRALYQQAYGDQLADQRSQDFANNAANTGIMNQFNQANANTRNQAQMYNQQNVADTFKYNQAGRQGNQQQNFQNEVTKKQGVTGANQQMANNYLADSAAKSAQGAAMIGALAPIAGAGIKQWG